MLKIIMDETMPLYERTTEDVKSMIKYAKLDERNLTQISQAIYYPSASDVLDKYKLLELNSHLLAEIQEGQTLCFKGALHEKVVLCSDSKTFELKEAEISNSLLVVAELLGAQETSTSPIKSPKDGVNKSMDRSLEDDDVNMEETNGTEPILRNLENRQVLKIFHEYYECREIKPKLRKIGDLLLLTRFSGPENEFAIDRNLLFSFKQLLDTAQCSRAEFQDAITQFRAIEIDNKLRVMEFEYEYRVISMMLGLINENSWDLDEINKDTTFESLVDIFPPEVVEGLFDIYTEKVNEYPCRYKYREDLVCRVIAQNILQPGLKFHVEEFLVTWQGALPENILIGEKYLKGIGIIDRDSTTPCVRALSESSLSTNLNERLNILFKTKERWTLEQIQPYIEFFTSPQLQVTAILAKYARSLVVDGVRIYVAKHR